MIFSSLQLSRWMSSAVLFAAVAAVSARAQTTPLALPYTIQTVAGGGTGCTGGDALGNGCLATQAILGTTGNLQGVTVDAAGNIYVADSGNSQIRRVDANTGVLTLVAGGSTICAAALDAYGDGCSTNFGAGITNGTKLYKITSIAFAKNGDIYFTGGGSLVQKISAATGVMSVVAGVTSPSGKTGTYQSGYTGDGGLATAAKVNIPRGVAVDANNNVYIADYTNNVVRKVDGTTGNITTIAGSTAGTAGSTGDGGPAASALLYAPSNAAVDGYGNLYIVDSGNKKIRMIYAGGGVAGIASPVVGNIYTVAGGGSVNAKTLTPTKGTNVGISTPRQVYVDPWTNNVYISDTNEVIWFFDAATGWMRPIAGTYGPASSSPATCTGQTDPQGDNCPALQAVFHAGSAGYGMSTDALGNLYICDPGDLSIRKVYTNTAFPATAPTAPVTKTIVLHYGAGLTQAASNALVFGNTDYVAGTPSCVLNGDNTTDCTLTVTLTPTAPGTDNATLVTKDSAGNVGAVGFTGAGTVAALGLDPGIATAVGSGLSAPQSSFNEGNGNILIADTGNNRVVRYNIAGATQTVIAGTGTAGNSGNGGVATAATLRAPKAVAEAADGTIYIADTGNNQVRSIDPRTQIISTAAGGATAVCGWASDTLGDACPGTQATLNAPSGLGVDGRGNVYIADTGNNRIRVLEYGNKYVYAFAGGAATVCAGATDTVGDGCAALQATLSAPIQLRMDVSGNLLVADSGDNMVRRFALASTGQPVTAVAGTLSASGAGDGGSATSAGLSGPQGIALDGAGSLYIADTGNHAVRMVSAATGIITTLAGTNGTSGTGTLPGSAVSTLLKAPGGVGVTGAGTVYVMDTGNNRALAINRNTLAFSFGSVNITSSSPVQTVAVTSTGSAAASLGTPLVTGTGSTSEFTFAAATNNGCSAAQQLAAGASCAMTAQYIPTLAGNHTATYTFAGNTGVNAPVPSVGLTGGGVVLVKTTTAVVQTSPTGNPQYGQATVATVTVTPASQGTSAISGKVTLTIDGNVQAPVSISVNGAGNGVAAITLPALNVGTHTITALYGGDVVYGGSATTAALSVTVTKAAANVALAIVPTSAIQFQSVTMTATVSAATGGVPTGTVSFLNGTTALGTGTVNASGVATFTTTSLAIASYSVVASYAGDTNFTAGSSTTVALVVAPDPPDFSASAAGTALGAVQGGVAQTTLTITPTNTLVGNVTFGCTGLPAYAACTFQPSVLPFTLTTDAPATTLLSVWTNVSPGVTTAAIATQRGLWLALLLPMGLLALGRRKVGRVLVVACLMVAISFGINGCGQGARTGNGVTPAGVTTVSVVVTGPSGQTHTLPITFTVVASK